VQPARPMALLGANLAGESVKTSMITVDRVSCRLILVSLKDWPSVRGRKDLDILRCRESELSPGKHRAGDIKHRRPSGGHVRGCDRGGAEWRTWGGCEGSR
jgi:hypothetical protein